MSERSPTFYYLLSKNPLNFDEIALHVLYVIVFGYLTCIKGQLISEAIVLAFKAPKKHTQILALASKMAQLKTLYSRNC